VCGELGSLGHQKTLEEVEGEHRMEGAFQVEEVGQYSLAEAVEEEEEEEGVEEGELAPPERGRRLWAQMGMQKKMMADHPGQKSDRRVQLQTAEPWKGQR